MMMRRIQRLVARKMGCPTLNLYRPRSPSLPMELKWKIVHQFSRPATDAYQTKLKQWEEDRKQQPDAKQPEAAGRVK